MLSAVKQSFFEKGDFHRIEVIFFSITPFEHIIGFLVVGGHHRGTGMLGVIVHHVAVPGPRLKVNVGYHHARAFDVGVPSLLLSVFEQVEFIGVSGG